MADTQTTVALNIGSQRVSMAIFEASKNGALILKGYDSESISADPSLDAMRASQTRLAIDSLAKRLKVGKTKARYAISGQSVFTRFVKLPPLQDDNIEQLVTFEAQQHVPFPLQEVIWDYELLEGTGEKEVVIVAIKSDALDEMNSAVNDSGLATIEVDVAPMAIYNAFRASYGYPEETILLIDIGAKTSNLLYIEGRRFFTRSVPHGGVAVTSAIAKEYNISYDDAELQKIQNGLVALGGGHTEQLDESVAALATIIRNALTKLPAEVSRTTNFYRSQHGGSAPRRVMLAGGGSNLPYTLELFNEKLNLPVEYFNPIGNLALGKGVDAEKVQSEGHMMGELVGLGLRGIGKSSLHIDLVPHKVAQQRAAVKRKPFLLAAAAMLILGVAGWAVFQNMAATNAKSEAAKMEEQRNTLAPIKSQLDQLLRKEGELQKIASSYVDLEIAHTSWLDLLSEIRGAFASDAVWITDLDPITNYNPLSPLTRTATGRIDPTSRTGVSVIKEEFLTTAYGTSNLMAAEEATIEEDPNSRGRGAQEAAPSVPMANAIRIKGFWRANPKSQNIVTELLNNLRSKSTIFAFTVKDANGADVLLGDDKLLDITISGKSGDFGLPFEINLPLVRSIAIK